MVLLQQMVILFLLMIVGFILKKSRLITSVGEKTLSAVVVNAANPAMVLAASINKENTIRGTELLRTFGLIIVVYAILIGLAWVLTRLLKVPVGQRGAYQNMTVFSNIGFMGFPLVAAMFGSEAMLYASLFVIPYNILIYTYAYVMMDRDLVAQSKSGESVSSENAAASGTDLNGGDEAVTVSMGDVSVAGEKLPASGQCVRTPGSRDRSRKISGSTLKKIFNIGVITSILTIIIYLTQVPVPKFIESAVDHLSSLTAPLSMIVIGSSMADMKLKDMFSDVRLLIYSGIKLLIIPVIGVLLIRLTGASPMFVGVCMIMLGTPVGAMTAMLAQTYGSNRELSARGVALTTVLSVATLPIVSMIVL